MRGFENWPQFCSFCSQVGHDDEDCFKKDRSRKPGRPGCQEQPEKQIYIPKSHVNKGKAKLVDEVIPAMGRSSAALVIRDMGESQGPQIHGSSRLEEEKRGLEHSSDHSQEIPNSLDQVEPVAIDSPPVILGTSTSRKAGLLGDQGVAGSLHGVAGDLHHPFLEEGEFTDLDSGGETIIRTSNSFAVLDNSFALEAELCPHIDRPFRVSYLVWGLDGETICAGSRLTVLAVTWNQQLRLRSSTKNSTQSCEHRASWTRICFGQPERMPMMFLCLIILLQMRSCRLRESPIDPLNPRCQFRFHNIELHTPYVAMLDPINLIVWKIRGASRVDSLRYLHELCHDNHVQLVVLLEPMSQVDQLEVVHRHLHLDHAASFLGGKVWFFWHDNMRLNFLEHAE